jgi:hypothetical protein
VAPYGYFGNPIAPKMRIRYKKEVVDNKFTTKMSYTEDCFSERPILIGVMSYKK